MKNSAVKKANHYSLILGGLGIFIWVLIIASFGNTYDTIHKLDVLNIIPPLWLWRLTFSIWFFLVGYAAGNTIYSANTQNYSPKDLICDYRGGIFFVAAFFLSLFHYPLFFVAQKLLLALISVLSAAVMSTLCGFNWAKNEKVSGLIMLAFSFWLFYVVFINLSIFLRI